MIDKYSCLLLLNDIQKKGIDVNKEIVRLNNSHNVPLETLKFINDNEPMDLAKFYEKLRKSYNDKKSTLYKNLMKEDFSENPQEMLITLNSYALQILIFAKTVEDKALFYKFARLDEVYMCLSRYAKDYDLAMTITLLRLIKADIKVLESLYR